jgi:hypothetical protein
VLDPRGYGPKKLGGPWPIQLWRREPIGVFARVVQGAGPARSEVLDAWVRTNAQGVRISDDSAGTNIWLTGEEAERAAKEAERIAKETEQQARLDLEQRVLRLETELHERK